MTTNNNALTTTKTNALDRLSNSQDMSIDEFVRAKTRRSVLVVDCSSSMGDPIRSGGRKIDALRKVASELQQTHPVPVVAFHGRISGSNAYVCDGIPEPSGGTPMHDAFDFCREQGASHIVLVTDGEPTPGRSYAIAAAKRFGGPIDTFYIGNGNDSGAEFCKMLADMTGGTANLTDLGAPKQLASKIKGLLGEGQKQIGGGR